MSGMYDVGVEMWIRGERWTYVEGDVGCVKVLTSWDADTSQVGVAVIGI